MKNMKQASSLRITAIGALLLGVCSLSTPCRADILYVANYSDNTIEKFTAGGVASVFASTGLSAPFGLAFDNAGNLYASNASYNNNTIEKFTPGGVASVFASTGLNGPFGLAFDSVGNLYAANLVDNTIEKFTPGGVASVFASTGLRSPSFSLAFDSVGNLYAANYADNTIEEFTPGGVASVFANTGLNYPTALAFTTDSGTPLAMPNQVVPEPGTWALLALSAPALLGAMRRRQRAA